jgi:hypothetical protein
LFDDQNERQPLIIDVVKNQVVPYLNSLSGLFLSETQEPKLNRWTEVEIFPPKRPISPVMWVAYNSSTTSKQVFFYKNAL